MRTIGRSEGDERAISARSQWAGAFGGCGICALAAGASGPVVHETSLATCALNRLAARPGHLVIALRRHVERIAALSWEEYEGVQRLAWEAARALEAVMSPQHVFVASLGSPVATNKSFPHVHVHVVPLADGGEADRPANVFTWDTLVVYEDEEADALASRVRAAWPR